MDSVNGQVNTVWQYAAYAALSLVALIFTVVLLPTSSAYFRRYFGNVNPALVVIGAAVLGAAALGVLHARGGFEIFRGQATWRGIALAAALATLFAVAIVIADLILRYPEGINVPAPQALLFYPAIGFVAEIVFHLLPLALLMLVLVPLAGPAGSARMTWLAILIVAALEPTFQIVLGEKPLTIRAVYTWVHIFAIGLVELYLFRRYDFVSMVSFRLFYYAYWHIAWGVLRLRVLF